MSKEDVTQVSFVDTILQSPYSSIYQKPIRIMKVDSEGNQSVETTTTMYKSINDPVSIEKINQICENIIQEKMLNSISKIMSSISDQFIQMEQRMISYLETRQQDNIQSLEDKIFSEIQFQTERQIEVLENHLHESKEHIDQEINSRFIEIIQEEVRKALENITETELQEVQDFNLDLSSCKIVDDYLPDEYEITSTHETLQLATEILSEYPVTEQEKQPEIKSIEKTNETLVLEQPIVMNSPSRQQRNSERTGIKRSNSYIIDENLLPDGTDMIFDDHLDFLKISDDETEKNTIIVEQEITKTEATEPVVTEPDVTEPAILESVVTEPVVTESVVTESVVTESVVTEPDVTEPAILESVVTEPAILESVVTEPAILESIVTEPVVTEPDVTEPKVSLQESLPHEEIKISNEEPSKSKKKPRQTKNKVFKTPKTKQVV